jgi:hypothetical protein
MNNDSSAIYAQAMEELKLGTYDLGVYGRALCECDGNESVAKARYIKARVAQIKAQQKEEHRRREADEHRLRLAAWNNNRFYIRRRSSSSAADDAKKTTRHSSTVRVPENNLVNMIVKWVSF